jgi:UrcA family protein
MKYSKIVKSLLTTIVIAALVAPTIASAGDRDELKGVSMKVSYADLNVNNEKDAKALYRRLKQASKYVCDYRRLNVAGSVGRMADLQRCYTEALSAAVDQVDNELVTKIHNS